MNPLLFHVIDLLAKSAGIVLLALATLSFWRSASAAQRCAVWLAAFFVLLLLPVTLLWQPLWSIALMEPTAEVQLPELSTEILQLSSNLTVPTALPEAQSWLPGLSATQWIALVWLAGFVGLLAQRMIGSLQLRRLRSHSHPVQDEHALALTARVAADLGVERGISLRMAPSVTVPLTWGSISPVLLLPAEALEWDNARLEAALRHEMGHIRHCDALTRLVTTFITALYWPNVLVWLAAKAWRTAQEQAADDLVISAGAVAENYALQLLDAARSVQAAGGLRAPAMAMAQPSTLETRLSAIMDDSRNRCSYSMRGALTGFVAAAATLVLCATAQLRGADEKPMAPPYQGGTLRDKARAIILPQVKFRDASLQQAVEYLQAKAIELDPQHAGLNLVIEKPDLDKGTLITLDLTNVPVSEALSYLASLSNRVMRYEAQATVIAPMPAPGAMITRSFKLPAGAGAKITHAKEWLLSQGVVFEGAASAAVVAEGSQLVVKNTQAQQQVVEAVVSKLVAGDAGAPVPAAPAAPPSPLVAKAESIIIPTVQFRSATLPEALEFLRAKAREFDPDKKGVSILIRESDVPQNVEISLDLKTIPLTEALRYTAELAGMDLVAESYAFILKPKVFK
jgi:beta-lactamase regulating signal transducer with metallopeptidase domain